MAKVLTKRKKRKPLPDHVRKAASVSLKGNSFWQQRAKHGMDSLFKSPELLWESACEYFKWCDENPIMRAENKIVANGGGEGSSVELHEEPLRRPYSLKGFCLFLGCNTVYFQQFIKSETYKNNKGFANIIFAVRDVIENQQFEGASVGQFNANIISRMLGLVDRVDQTSGGEPIHAPVVQIVKSDDIKLANDEKEIE